MVFRDLRGTEWDNPEITIGVEIQSQFYARTIFLNEGFYTLGFWLGKSLEKIGHFEFFILYLAILIEAYYFT